jgi:AcrR family transcriptional regulator
MAAFQAEAATARAPRIVKPALVRQAELVDCAERLFLTRGYERTTINDVIAAAGVSKGAFYHHFRSKEDLLEACAGRVAAAVLAHAQAAKSEARLSALDRLNRFIAVSREWKADNMAGLRAMFTVLLRPENALLYHRIVSAEKAAVVPVLAGLIAEGARDGEFAVADAELVAEALLWLSESRRALVAEAMRRADAGEIEAAVEALAQRIAAEEAMADRLLGLPAGSVRLAGSAKELRGLVEVWVAAA